MKLFNRINRIHLVFNIYFWKPENLNRIKQQWFSARIQDSTESQEIIGTQTNVIGLPVTTDYCKVFKTCFQKCIITNIRD